MFVNRMPRYEILSADALAQLDAGWRRLVTEIGIEFMSDRNPPPSAYAALYGSTKAVRSSVGFWNSAAVV